MAVDRLGPTEDGRGRGIACLEHIHGQAGDGVTSKLVGLGFLLDLISYGSGAREGRSRYA